MKYGLQMYSVRDESAKDFTGTLRKVAEIGYDGVEFAGYGGLTASELKRLMDELQLQTASTHVSYDRMMADADKEIDYILELDCRYLTIPFLGEEHRKDEDSWRRVIADLQKIGEKCAARGVQLFYHNHDFEFRQQIAGKTVFDAIFESVSDSLLKVELDACWAYYGGYDPVAYIEKYANRLPLLHMKDMRTLEDGKALTVELGEGEVKLMDIANAAKQAGVEWMIVEQDYCQNPSIESVTTSFNWIKKHL